MNPQPTNPTREAQPSATPRDLVAQEHIRNNTVPEPNSGCWLWVKALNSRGYGSMVFRGRAITAHKLSYEAFKGDVPNGLYVCHKCDTPACANPDHLWAGTPKQNLQDSYDKRRRGRIPSSEIPEILRRRAAGEELAEIGKTYGVSDSGVCWTIRKRSK